MEICNRNRPNLGILPDTTVEELNEVLRCRHTVSRGTSLHTLCDGNAWRRNYTGGTDEPCARRLSLKDGIAAKLADDLYCGADTPKLSLRIGDASYRHSTNATCIFPFEDRYLSTTILGWVWSAGQLSGSPHRIILPPYLHALYLTLYVAGVHLSVRYLGRVLPKCSPIIAPLESAISGQQSGERIQWTDTLHEHFHLSQTSLTTRKSITLPRPPNQCG